MAKEPILYNELASWWPLVSSPDEYEEEATIFRNVIYEHCLYKPVSMFELGSGGGNNAYHLKKYFKITLSDLSAPMLEISKKLNPECRHIPGDMKDLRTGETYDVVFIHDGVDYMSTLSQLSNALTTAYLHCRENGIALFVPDYTNDNFEPATSHGGHDNEERGVRYLQWIFDPDPDDKLYSFHMLYLFREGNKFWQSDIDEHICGLYSEKEWMDSISSAGFIPKKVPYKHSEFEKDNHCMFVGIKAG